MFAYCQNNPVNYVDSFGLHSSPCAIAFEGYGAGDQRSALIRLLEKIFGAGVTSEYHHTQENELMPYILNWFFSVKWGTTTTYTYYSAGNSDAILSVYAIGRIDDPILSSAGAKINAGDYTLDTSFGLDDMSINFIQKDGDVEYAATIVVDISQLKMGIEGSITSPVPGQPNVTKTEYVNVSVTGYGIIALLAYLISGQFIPQSSFSPAPAPII